MAHFAKLDENNVVLEVNVVDNSKLNDLEFPDSEQLGVDFLTAWSGGHSNWKQTSYNASFRKHYAGEGFTYDNVRDAFIPPKPFPSWVFVETSCTWNPPSQPPNDGKPYDWNEETLGWVENPNL